MSFEAAGNEKLELNRKLENPSGEKSEQF